MSEWYSEPIKELNTHLSGVAYLSVVAGAKTEAKSENYG